MRNMESQYKTCILIEPENLSYPFKGKYGTVSAQWDFRKTEEYAWINDNCQCEREYQYLDEFEIDEKDLMICLISFSDENCLKNFKDQFETYDFNFNITYSSKFKHGHYLYKQPDENWTEPSVIIKWCMENIKSEWAYEMTYENVSCSADNEFILWFANEIDATGFKLKWL